jgi:hypothetical protein
MYPAGDIISISN